MKVNKDAALSFSDVILEPQYSSITSRLNTSLETVVAGNIKLDIPILSTNMATVTEDDMMIAMWKLGGAGILHRFLPEEKLQDILIELQDNEVFPIIASIGVKEEDYHILHRLFFQCDLILIDIAHGDSLAVHNMVKEIVNNFSIPVAAGNIATADAAKRLCDLGVSAVRVGIGGGDVCSTRTVTGHGMPTLQSIMDVYPVTSSYKVALWGDGGFTCSGDIVKALAAGADCVTLGSLLAGTSKTPGEVFSRKTQVGFCPGAPVFHEERYKKFYGMSSKEAQELHREGLKVGTAAEGVSKEVPYRGETSDIINELLGGIRSGLTYSGAWDISQLRERAEFRVLSPGGIKESKYGK